MRVLRNKPRGRWWGTCLEYLGLDFILGTTNIPTMEEFMPLTV